MSCFTVCDGVDCSNNEGDNYMFSIPYELHRLLNEYIESDVCFVDLCEECLKEIAKDSDFYNKIGFTKYDELVLSNSTDCVKTLKEWANE